MFSAPTPVAPSRSGSPARPVAALLDSASTDDLAEQLTATRDLLTSAFTRARRPLSGISPAESRDLIDAVDLDHPLGDFTEVLDEVRRVYVDHAVWFHHPHYQAHLNCPVALPAVIGDVIAVAVNSSLDTWDQSGPATHMERHLIAWTAERLGLPGDACGVSPRRTWP